MVLRLVTVGELLSLSGGRDKLVKSRLALDVARPVYQRSTKERHLLFLVNA